MTIRFDHPELLWLLLLALPLAVLGWRAMRLQGPVQRRLAVALRVLSLALLVLILAGMQSVQQHTDLTVVAVVDQSESVEQFARFPPRADGGPPVGSDAFVRDWLTRAGARRRADDRFALITFDGLPTIRTLPSPGLDLESGTVPTPTEGTDPATALRLGLALFPADSGKRLLLVWDGNPTVPMDRVLAAAREAKAAGVPIGVLPVEYRIRHHVMVDEVRAPAEARLGQTVSLRIVLTATDPAQGVLRLTESGQSINLNTVPAPGSSPGSYPTSSPASSTWNTSATGDGVLVTADQWHRQELGGLAGASADGGGPVDSYTYVHRVDLPMTQTGACHFEATFEPAEGTASIPAHNRAASFTFVHGRGRILLLDHGDPGSDILPAALRAHGLDVEVLPDTLAPYDLDVLLRYDAVLLQDVPADSLSPAQQQMLVRYVNDLGGGLVMIGGPNSFGAGDWAGTALDRILPVQCQLPSQNIMPAGALVLIIDRSGSMGEGVGASGVVKEEVASRSAIGALQTLYPKDLVGVIAFDVDPMWVVPLQRNDRPYFTAGEIKKITPGGGTRIAPALDAAYQALRPLRPGEAALKHVVLLTDGDSPDGEECRQVAKQMHQAHITLSTIGIGDDVNPALLDDLARIGGGRYHFVNDPHLLPQIFIKEARNVRKNLIKEQDFVPQIVAGSPILAGVSTTPVLKGLVLTAEKKDPLVNLVLRGPEGEPVFAHWQVGLGRVAAFTSDASNRWAVHWLTWEGYGDFWARTVRAMARPSPTWAYDLASSFRGEQLHIRLDASRPSVEAADGRGASGEFPYLPEVPGRVLMPDGSTAAVTLHQTEPGVYEAEVRGPQPGNYIVNLFVGEGSAARAGPTANPAAGAPGGVVHLVTGGASRPPGEELRVFASNRANLEAVAEASGGRMLDAGDPRSADLYSRESLVATASIRPLWRPLLVLLLAVFLLDVAVRRIAWDWASTWRWLVQRLDQWAGLLRPREVSAGATMAALKTKARQVERKLAAPPAPNPTQAAVKFEAQPGAVAQADFAAAVGAARVPPPAAATPPQPPGGGAGAEGATTAHLLEAKRRAQQRLPGGAENP